MKLTNYIIDLGRTVAYFPKLKKVTGSTTATILLCQFLYWTDKTRDGWIWKTSDEIEEETGLTYNEQKTARKKLIEAGLLVEERKRLDFTIRFKVDQESLNRQWEELTHEESKLREMVEVVEEQKPNLNTVRKPRAKKTDVIQPVAGQLGLPLQIEEEKKKPVSTDEIKFQMKKEMALKIEKTLEVLPNNKRWLNFIDFAVSRQLVENEDIETFMKYALRENFDPIYWTPEKMKTLWLQAFKSRNKPKPLERPEEDWENLETTTYAPMPEDLKVKRTKPAY